MFAFTPSVQAQISGRCDTGCRCQVLVTVSSTWNFCSVSAASSLMLINKLIKGTQHPYRRCVTARALLCFQRSWHLFYLCATHPDHTTWIAGLQHVAGKEAALAQKYCQGKRLSLIPGNNQVLDSALMVLKMSYQVLFRSSTSQENKTLHKREYISQFRRKTKSNLKKPQKYNIVPQ